MKYLTNSGLSYFLNKIKAYIASQLNSKANLTHTHSASDITSGLATVATSGSYNDLSNKPTTMTPKSHTHGNITNAGAIGSTANKPLITTTGGTVTTGSFGTSANTFCEGNDSRLSDARTPTSHTHSASDITSGLATVATSGSYNDLSNKPTIPTVNNATLTIQKNGTTVKTFTANASSNVTANITVPTKTSDLTNDSHTAITMGTDSTSTASPAHGGTFTCIDSVTKDTNGHVTAVNTKTVTLPSDNNTDTKVTQNVSTANENHPILLSATKDATTNQGAKTSIFASGVKVNPSTGTVTATAFSGNLTGNVTGNLTGNVTGNVSGSSGSCTGNSATATKATNNANGKELTNTIIKGLSISGKTITYTQIDGTTGTLTTQDTNTTYSNFVKSGSGAKAGLVPAPSTTAGTTKYLREDGTWQVPPDHTYTVNNATLTIQKNGTTVKTFTANASSNVTCNITVPTKTSELTNNSGFLTSHQSLSGYVPRSGGAVMTGDHLGKTTNNSHLLFSGGIDWDYGACVSLYGKDSTSNAGTCLIRANDGTNDTILSIQPSGTIYKTTNGNLKNLAMQEDTVPRSGGAVMTGNSLGRISNDGFLRLDGGIGFDNGSSITFHGKDLPNSADKGKLYLHTSNGTQGEDMMIYPNGTWTWSGTACQITSDQRLKQQIAEIDDKLLDAWEDVNLVQFKYNDAVDQKGDNARLHTGYVVQQIDEACQKHNIDISEYGLYCHEEYPEETEEVEVEQADGTKVKEKKVIREASEHYSLRYTETLVVECAYLRKQIKELKERLEKLEGNSK